MSKDIKGPRLDRRGFMGASTLGTGAALVSLGAAGSALAQQPEAADPAYGAPQVDFPENPRAFGGSGTVRTEMDLRDCEVEGDWPKDLDGAFYRVGPDPQYPKPPEFENDVPFDGEGHVSMFRVQNGHVDYKTRYAKNARYVMQARARRSLYGMYRNPTTDHASVRDLNRGTANTQLFTHHGKLLVFKEDSPPVAMDPLTLETTDPEYTFGGKLESKTHTAHPKIDPLTGEFVSFGYEAGGFLSKDVNVFSADKDGKITWSVTVEAPYAGMMHDFCVTQDYVVLYLVNLVADPQRIAAGGVHFSYDSTAPCYMGVLRRGGDGSDVKWLTGPNYFCTHVMGGWNDGTKITVDMDGGEGNQFPFFPSLHEPWDPMKGRGFLRRFTVDMATNPDTYEAVTIFPELEGMLARQDDRFHTLPYRYGYLLLSGPQGGWGIIDHQTGTTRIARAEGYSLSEMTFVPRTPDAPEGDGYLIGLGSSIAESGRSNLFLFDLADVESGPRAWVKMPYPCVGQVHGWWADASAIGAA